MPTYDPHAYDVARVVLLGAMAFLAGCLGVLYVWHGRASRAMRWGGASAIAFIATAAFTTLRHFWGSPLWWDRYLLLWAATLLGLRAVWISLRNRKE